MTRKTEAPVSSVLLRAGDPITIVYGVHQIILHTYVTKRDGSGTFVTIQLPRTTENIALADERLAWVRGHRMINAPEVVAALKAQAAVIVANAL